MRSGAIRACPGQKAPCNLKPLKSLSRTAMTAAPQPSRAAHAVSLGGLRRRSPRSTDFGRKCRGGRPGSLGFGRARVSEPSGSGRRHGLRTVTVGTGCQYGVLRLRSDTADITGGPARTSVFVGFGMARRVLVLAPQNCGPRLLGSPRGRSVLRFAGAPGGARRFAVALRAVCTRATASCTSGLVSSG